MCHRASFVSQTCGVNLAGKIEPPLGIALARSTSGSAREKSQRRARHE